MNRLQVALLILLALIPASVFAGITIDGSLTNEYSGNPGDSFSGSIIIKNTGNNTEEVKIYQHDYSSNADGQSFYTEPGSNPRSNSAWIEITPRKIFIKAGEDYTAFFSITYPEDESLSGTYWSMMMVEAIPDTSAESSQYDPASAGIGVQTILRYGIRMITHIGNSGTIKPEVTSSSLVLEDGQPVLQLDIANTGTRLLRISTWAELYTEKGDLAGKYEGDRYAVFPGSSIHFRINLKNTPKNKYQAVVVLDCGENNVFGINYDLRIE
ncbi:MAG: hypothetical protein JW874_10035 [Spirochaetales bacterium]|nr:hypothetical protein [Spirochaetales bacterium]